MKKKVLFIITKSNWGGAQRYVFDLATHLPKEDFDICVALGGSGNTDATPGLLDTRLQGAGIRSIYIQSFMRDISLIKECRAFWELLKIFAKEKPDIVHLNSSKAGGLGALAARIAGVPSIIFTSHGLPYEEDRNTFARALIFLATWVTFLLSTKVIVVSQSNYERAHQLPGCRSKIYLIHNGIPELIFLSPEKAQQVLSAKMPYGRPWIGVIAEYTHNKGLSFLIEAAGILKEEHKPVSLCLIGEGEERLFLEKLAREKNVAECVWFLGFIPEAYQYLTAFDIVVLPSLKEGLPYVLLEAGQAERAVVASDVGGVGDIIKNNISGFLCTPGNTRDIAAKLLQLLENPQLRIQFGKALQQHIALEFSLERELEKTIALYSAIS